MSDLCKCTFAIRMNGDGCRHCQPQGYIDRLEDQAKDHADRIEALEAVLRQAREVMKIAVAANNFRFACLASNSSTEKIDYADKVFWSAMDDLSAIAAIDAALKE